MPDREVGRTGRMEIFVTGATGAVGRPLVEALVGQGHQVLAATRRPEAYEGSGTPVSYDADAPISDDLARHMARADAAYYLIHALDRRHFARLDRARAERFSAAWGAERPVVYLGGLGEPGTGSAHLRSRQEVGTILHRRCRTVELRASLVIGAHSLSFRLLARLGRLASFSPIALPAPRAAATLTQPIAQADLVRLLVHALELDPGTYDVGGPEVVPYGELLERSARIQGRGLRVRPGVALDPTWIGPSSALAAGTDPWATSALFSSMATETTVRESHRVPGPELATTGLDAAIADALAQS